MTGYGPAEFGSVLQGIGTLAGACAVAYAAWTASNTFDGWRRQKLSERRIEQAERILTAAYKARRALGYVRNPLMLAHELHAAREYLAKRDDWAGTDRKESLVTAQAYYNRLSAVREERQAVEECLPMARALFGEKVEAALEVLNRQFHMVSIAVEMNSMEGNDRNFSRELRGDLSSSAGTNRPNEMNVLIEEQVKLIEGECVPVLRLGAK